MISICPYEMFLSKPYEIFQKKKDLGSYHPKALHVHYNQFYILLILVLYMFFMLHLYKYFPGVPQLKSK